ncbi:MAG: hypothetical protein GX282_04735 [Campylobacteraceae bacterium]|nr:hypothetical protein [Campylobacteraceae bacterium]
MRKIILILLVVFSFADAKVQRLSPVPPASIEYIDLDPAPCDLSCLQELSQKNLIFSFLARYDESVADAEMKALYLAHSKGVAKIVVTQDMKAGLSGQKIAILLPEKTIGGYSHVISDAVFAYIISEEINAEVKFYLTGTEEPNALMSAIKSIERDGISLVIAPVTARGANFLSNYSNPNTLFFIPTLHYSAVKESSGNLFFGGIDYEEQVEKLLNVSNSDILILHDESALAKSINSSVMAKGEVTNSLTINTAQSSLTGRVAKKPTTVFLNLPTNSVARSISELKIDGFLPEYLLSTQINYAPRLLSLVGYEDRKNLYIANSIGNVPENIAGVASVLNLDIYFNWVAYSTVIGLDYLYSTFANPEHKRVFSEPVIGSSISYDTRVYRSDKYKFIEN